MEEEKTHIPLEVRSYIVAQSRARATQKEIVNLVNDEFGRQITQGAISKIIYIQVQ